MTESSDSWLSTVREADAMLVAKAVEHHRSALLLHRQGKESESQQAESRSRHALDLRSYLRD